MKFGLNNNTIDKINKVFVSCKQINKAIIYGSRAKGNYKNGSDIDLVLQGENIDFQILNKIINDIDELLLPYSFDISTFDSITNTDLIEHINRVGKVFYEKEV